jgi:hypothetical protein
VELKRIIVKSDGGDNCGIATRWRRQHFAGSLLLNTTKSTKFNTENKMW